MDHTLADAVAAAPELAAGTQLGRFTLRRVLGEGGMGVVWAAHDPDLDREIAIKLLRHHAKASHALRKRLLREARAMARLKHPNVITVYEVGTSGDTDFIAMELVEGLTLDAWLAHDPPKDEVWGALLAAGRGLAAAHAAGLVHRDFKPHNVLRSRDGRVLVTDFGLARGLGDEGGEALPAGAQVAGLEETLEASPVITPSRVDSVLDSPLTQTGAMIGTPAYMAPEQFQGAPPDPRTDQFAYCITAWQALTGARPFLGATLEELRAAALRGVDGVIAELAKPVRAVLARGLDPDPTRRWPDLDALLDALEAARRPPRRRWPYLAATGVAMLAVVAVLARRRDEAVRFVDACAPAEEELAETWSDAARDELATVAPGAADRIGRAFERFRGKWKARYQEACNAPRSPIVDARLACLRGVRDEAVVLRHALRGADRRVLETLDAPGMLPNLAACTGPAPLAPPEMPRAEPQRARVLAVLARALTLRTVAPDELAAATDRLVAEATATGWKPLVPMVQVTAGNTFLRLGDGARARTLLRAALPEADLRFQALVHLGLLEASVRELERPGDGESRPRPGALHEELARELTYARSAVRAAGNDPMLAGALAMLEAEAHAGLGLWTRYRPPYRTALELVAEARKAFEQAGDWRRVAQVAAYEASLYLWRGDDRALDDALFVVRSAEEGVAAAELKRVPALDELRAQLAFARGELREAHERYDRISHERRRDAPAIRGRVTDRAGHPVRATVVVWRGALRGDPVRAYTDPWFDGTVVDTAIDGTFEVPAGDALIAEAGGLRSVPQPGRDGVTLVVDATASEHGTIAGAWVPRVEVIARYAIGRASWTVHAPVGRDGSYRLDGLPRAPHVLGVVGPAGDGTRTRRTLAWPTGPAIELVVRAREPAATGWIFRGEAAPATRADAEALAATATDVATTSFHPVGADATAAGREVYAAGDRHAILIGNAPGEVTACVALDEAPTAPVACSPLVVPDEPGESPRVLPVRFDAGS